MSNIPSLVNQFFSFICRMNESGQVPTGKFCVLDPHPPVRLTRHRWYESHRYVKCCLGIGDMLSLLIKTQNHFRQTITPEFTFLISTSTIIRKNLIIYCAPNCCSSQVNCVLQFHFNRKPYTNTSGNGCYCFSNYKFVATAVQQFAAFI